MKILIAGATGVLGKRVVPLLIERGHEVIGLSRSAANDEQLAGAGATSIRADLFDEADVIQAAKNCEAVLHLATAIPTTSPGDWSLNDRIRREGTANLIAAALANGCSLYLQQSISFLYGQCGDAWVDERFPLDFSLPNPLQSALDMERMVQQATDEHELPAVTLRFGSFYSADSALTQARLAEIASGRYRVVGDGSNYVTLIQVDDAAQATVAATEQGENHLGAVYNVGDDDPPREREFADWRAEQLGAARPGSVDGTPISTRCSNRKLVTEMNWHPRYPSFREGFPAVIEAWRQQ